MISPHELFQLWFIQAVHNWQNDKNKSGLYSIHIRVGIRNIYKYYRVRVL